MFSKLVNTYFVFEQTFLLKEILLDLFLVKNEFLQTTPRYHIY